MRNLLFGVAAAALMSTSIAVGAAQADPRPQLIFGVDRPGDEARLERVQFLFGGHNFCWYDSGWQGPGFYWCGYANRRGLGWGGGDGFHGWRGGHGAPAGGGARAGGQAAHAGGARMAAAHAPAAHGATAHAAAHAAADHGGGGDRKPGA